MAGTESHLMASVREADPDRYLSTLYAPEEKREGLLALYAFNVEIASIRDRVRDPLPGEVRLQWWRDAIEARSGQGNPTAEALLQTIERYRLPLEPFMNYLEARIFDLYDDPMPSRSDLEGYCGETASAVIQLASLILDPEAARGAAEAAGHAGCAQATTGIMRSLPIHRARGQCFIPLDLLTAAGLDREAFLSGEGDDRSKAVVSAMVALGREHLAGFMKHARALPRTLRPAFLPIAVASAALDRAERMGAAAFTDFVEISAPRRQWLVARRAIGGWR